MKTTNFAQRNALGLLLVAYCLTLCFAFAGCALQKFSRLEKEALKYGTVSVGAARVTDYNNEHLQDARKRLRKALMNIHKELRGDPNMPARELSAATGGSKNSNPEKESSGVPKGQAPRPSEIELVGLRMAALKFVESELEDVNLCKIDPNEPNFRRVVVSLDCSAWVRGKAGAALVYIDLYPYKVDTWCHEAAQIMKEWWNEVEKAKQKKTSLPPSRKEYYQKKWEKLIDKELANKKSDNAFKCLDNSTRKMPEDSDIDDKRDPSDWVAFCHRWLGKKGLCPHIVHVERMGKAEYLILAEADSSTTKFGISGGYPGLASAELGVQSREEAKRQMAAVRPLSLAFVAGDRRAGWLFMPSRTEGGRMPPTERRLRIVVDVPEKLSTLGVHIHKVFLGPDLGMLPGATLARQVENLDQTRQTLTYEDKLYKKYKGTEPRHYRLIKTRMRNLLYQGWAEEIPVDIPPK